MKILILHGPNLNMLGKRDPKFYGQQSLEDLNKIIEQKAESLSIKVDIYQENAEAELIKHIHEAPEKYDALIINPAAFTHYSIAIRDALGSIDLPKVEVHLSNVHARESFRQESYTAAECIGQISGFGSSSYLMALDYLVSYS